LQHLKILCTQQINNFIFNEPPQGQWFVENKIAGISLLAAFLGVAIAGSLHAPKTAIKNKKPCRIDVGGALRAATGRTNPSPRIARLPQKLQIS